MRVHGRSLLVRVALGALLTLCMLPWAAPRAQAAELGLDVDLTWFPGSTANAQTASILADSGSRWVRLTVGWHDFEPARGVYDPWSLAAYETEIRRARDAGQRVLLLIQETPAWASGTTDRHAPPRDPADFARFARFLATRYGASVDAYEVWNEPNYSRFWTGAPDPAAYARLLKATYPEIKAADPSARVVFAGPSTNDWGFVEAAYAAGVQGSFDVLGAHPYSCRGPDDIRRDAGGRMTRDTFLGYRELRASMLANGDDKPIWVTEFGWSTTSAACGVSEQTQARYLARAVELMAGDPYVEVALYYHLRNSFQRKDADEIEGRYGLLRSDFTPKPSFEVFRRLARTATTGAAPQAEADSAVGAEPLPSDVAPAVGNAVAGVLRPGTGGQDTARPPTSTATARRKATAKRTKAKRRANRRQRAQRAARARRSRSTKTATTAIRTKSGSSTRSPKSATSSRL